MFDDSNIAINPLAVLKPVKEPRIYTLAQYLRREERSEELHEYYNGIIIKLPAASGSHNIIAANVGTSLNNAIDATDKNYQVLGGKQAIYSTELNFSLYPDVLVVADTLLYFDQNEVLLINPILIVEVVSRSKGKYDRRTKFDEYKTIDTFKEYLLIDPKKCHIESRFREEPDLWRYSYFTDVNQSIHLKSLGCSIDLTDIYKNITLK